MSGGGAGLGGEGGGGDGGGGEGGGGDGGGGEGGDEGGLGRYGGGGVAQANCSSRSLVDGACESISSLAACQLFVGPYSPPVVRSEKHALGPPTSG